MLPLPASVVTLFFLARFERFWPSTLSGPAFLGEEPPDRRSWPRSARRQHPITRAHARWENQGALPAVSVSVASLSACGEAPRSTFRQAHRKRRDG